MLGIGLLVMSGVVAINVQDTWLVQATDQTPQRDLGIVDAASLPLNLRSVALFTDRVASLYPLGAQISTDYSNS